jgi:hypothetical protein
MSAAAMNSAGSEGEALLAVIKKLLQCYVTEHPKDSMWRACLSRVEKAEVSEKIL